MRDPAPLPVVILAGDGTRQSWIATIRLQAYRPGQCSTIDPILQAMLASNHGISPASLLSLRPAFLWVSRDIR